MVSGNIGVRRQYTVRYSKVVFHLVWYSFVVPFLGAFAFLVIKYVLHQDFGIVKTIGSSLVGALVAVIFLCFFGLVISGVSTPIVLFLARPFVFLSHIILIPLFAWVVVPKGDRFFIDDLGWFAPVVFAVAVLTALVYDRFRVYKLYSRREKVQEQT